VAAAPGDVHRLYVVQRGGTIRVVRDGTVLPTPFVDLTGEVSTDDERGLLSMAFPPDLQTSRLFYVYFTDLSGNVRVDQLGAPTDDQASSPATHHHTVISIPHPASNHNGGTVQFGPDGYLYMAPGDGAISSSAQSLSTPLGKVLQVRPRPEADGYDIPAGNPFPSSPIWSYGLRNPFRSRSTAPPGI
jgi:glucose/arabinose dehydrogenase